MAKVVTEPLVLGIIPLVKLFLACLPERKFLEKKVLTSMMNVKNGEIKDFVYKHRSMTVGQ